MNLQDQLLAEMSRRNADYIAHYIGGDPELFKELVQFIFSGEKPLPLRASWIASMITDKHPELLKLYMKKIVLHLDKFDHPGIRRNLLRYIAEIEIPKSLEGKLYDVCFKYLLSRTEPLAVKVHSMQILFNIAKNEPDLQKELRLVLEELTNHESPALKSRSRQLMAKL